MEGLLALEELKKGYHLMLSLRAVVNEPSLGGGLVFAGELVEQVLRSITVGLSILSRGSTVVDDQDAFTKGPVDSNGAYRHGIRKYTGGRRLRRYSNLERHLTEKPDEDDGYVWKKYGQKTIHGAKHQRSYYRCSQHANQGCQATKQVQGSNENSKTFVVTKIGNHTCQTTFHASQPYLDDPSSSTDKFSITYRSNPSGFDRQQPQQQLQTPLHLFSAPLPNKTPVLQSPATISQTPEILDYNSASGYQNPSTSMEELEILQMIHSLCPMGLQENLGVDMAAAGDFGTGIVGCLGLQDVKEQEILDIDMDEGFKELVDCIGLQLMEEDPFSPDFNVGFRSNPILPVQTRI